MLRRKSIVPHDRPVYREVLPQALKIAWRHPQYWLLGLFAAILNGGSALDVCWKFWNAVQTQGSDFFVGQTVVQIWGVANYGGFHTLPFFQALVAIIALIVILLAFLAFSCISQASLVHMIGTWKNGVAVRYKQALHVGAKALVPVAVLNLIVLVFIWLSRFFVSLPLAIVLGRHNTLYMAVYLVSFIVFFVLALAMSILQVYALNAMILQGASLAEAFRRGWEVIVKHWLVTLETALLQALVVILISLVSLLALMVLVFPPAVLYVMAVLRGNFLLFQISAGAFIGIVIIFLIFFTGFTVSFQYALWTLMYRKMGEGGLMPKIHRLFRFATRNTKVPQA